MIPESFNRVGLLLPKRSKSQVGLAFFKEEDNALRSYSFSVIFHISIVYGKSIPFCFRKKYQLFLHKNETDDERICIKFDVSIHFFDATLAASKTDFIKHTFKNWN